MNSPFSRQIIMASSPQLAALSIGGISGFSNVILEQLNSNDSIIQLDFDSATWIGTMHGPAGVLSLAMPLIMQWKGRKFAYNACCLLVIIGWVLIYLAKDVTTIIIAECFHGFSIYSMIDVSFSTISEMIDPQYRTLVMTIYLINQTLGVTLTGIIGRYVHWKTISIILCVPIIIAFAIACMWPESPAWLAYKGEYVKCEQAFKRLRGSDENAQKELKELLNAQKENAIASKNATFKFKDLWKKVTSRDFYIPCLHIFITLSPFYSSGMLVILTYGIDILQKSTNNLSAARYGMIVSLVLSCLGSIITGFLVKIFKNKTVLVTSGLTSAFFMFGAAGTTWLQTTDVLSSDSVIVVYFIAPFMFFVSLGVSTLSFSVSGELMPVKHRVIGGIIYIFMIGSLHTLTSKFAPYIMLYIGIWRTFSLLGVLEVICILFIWKYVPETKGMTLQYIEDYYNNRSVVPRNNDEMKFLDNGTDGNRVCEL